MHHFVPPETAGRLPSWAELPPDEALLIWSMRHLLVCWPTCGSVEAALHRRWGDEATAIQHLLRCWLTGLSLHANRQFSVGDPTCGVLLADERAMLDLLRSPSAPGLSRLCENSRAARLLPLVADLARLTGVSDESEWMGQADGRDASGRADGARYGA